ncbi:hypothetical protein [Scytonema sp. PCC 10023]|uniref:hypothetical protein n=1 Tax=Scytonema sp. PCC 10023 TaxID=1680591 RepID=UPI0039C6DD7D
MARSLVARLRVCRGLSGVSGVGCGCRSRRRRVPLVCLLPLLVRAVSQVPVPERGRR